MSHHQKPPDIQRNWIKRFYRAKQKKWFVKKVQDYKDGSGLQFIDFDFAMGGQEIKVSILVKFSVF